MPRDVLRAHCRPGEPLLSKQPRGPRSGLKRAKSRPRITQSPTSPELPHPASPQGSSPHPSSLPPSHILPPNLQKGKKKIIIKPVLTNRGGGGGGGSKEAEPTAQIRLRCLHQTLREPERATGGWRALASKKINLQCKNNAGRPTLIGPGRQQLTGTACLARPPARLDLSHSLGLFPASVRGGEGAPHRSPPTPRQVSGGVPPALGPGASGSNPSGISSEFQLPKLVASQVSAQPGGGTRRRPHEASAAAGGRPRHQEHRPTGKGGARGASPRGPRPRALRPLAEERPRQQPPAPRGGNPSQAPSRAARPGSRGCHLQGHPRAALPTGK